jgi:hypothetical protein
MAPHWRNQMDEKILSKIQKLLCLAADNPDSPESKLAAERAAEMMAKYDIGLEDIQDDGTISDDGINEISVVANANHHQAWESQLASILCECFDCQRFVTSFSRNSKTRTFIGTKSDVRIAVWFYKYLRLRIAKQAEHEFRLQVDQKTFGMGAVSALEPRLVEMYKRKEEIILSDSRALMVNKQLAVKNYFESKYTNLKTRHISSGIGSKAALMAGRAAGQSISLNQQIGGS